MIKGAITALVTPFDADGNIDFEGFKQNLEFQLKEGIGGVLVAGTTGEGPTLSMEEWKNLLLITVERVKGKIPVIAGVGTNNTYKTIERLHLAEEAGADASLVITPYYNKPPQEGLRRHFLMVDKEAKKPIIIYNVPSRTGVNILPETVKFIVDNSRHTMYIKEASGLLKQIAELKLLCGDRLTILSGDDLLAFPSFALGAKGVISVVSNILPHKISEMYRSFEKENIKKAKERHYYLFPVIQALFVETNPIPVKEAMNILGLSGGKVRPPLNDAQEGTVGILKEVLMKARLL